MKQFILPLSLLVAVIALPPGCPAQTAALKSFAPQAPPALLAPIVFQSTRVIFIAANQTDAENGIAFAQAVARLSGVASASAPYLLSLGPGQFTLPPAGVIVPPFVSLRGSGMFTTVLTGGLTFTDAQGQVENTFQLEELSVVGAEDTIVVPNAGNIVFDHVFSNGIVVVNNREPDTTVLVTNSTFKFPFTVNANGVSTHVTILGTELDFAQNIYAQGAVVCVGTFNASGTLYSNNCAPNSTNSSTP